MTLWWSLRVLWWSLRHPLYAREYNGAWTGRCPCCDGPLALTNPENKTLWWSIGSGYLICPNHPQGRVWPVTRAERNMVLMLPLANWTSHARGSWAANTPDYVRRICGIPEPGWSKGLTKRREKAS